MGHYKTKSEFEFINRYLDSPKEILDIGGGSGRFAIPFQNGGHNVTVLDLSEPALTKLRERNSTINLIQSDFFQWQPSHENFYDLILSIEVLLYIKDWNSFFNKVHRLLKKNGVFIFTATNKKSWRTILQKIKDKNQPDYNYSIYSLNDYKKIINETNFRIDVLEGFLWIPCSINSNSKFVEIFARIEKLFNLNRFYSQSPWLIFAVKKL